MKGDNLNNRYYYFDNIKALLIFLVVFGHFIEPFITTIWFEKMYLLIYSFHMPLFAFVSGYFSKNVSFIGLKQLLFKLLFYQFLFALLFACINYLNPINVTIITDNLTLLSAFGYLLSPIWLLWYLLSLIIWKLLLFLFSSNKKMIIVAFFLGFVIILLPINGYVLSLQRTFGLFPFFLIGFYTTYNKIAPFLRKKNRIIISITLICITYLIYKLSFGQLTYEHFYYLNNHINNHTTILVPILIRLLTYIYSILMMTIVMLLVPEKQNKFSYFGINSFPIYIYHGVVYILCSSSNLFIFLTNTNFIIILLMILLLTILTMVIFGSNKFTKFEKKITLNNIKSRLGV